jgi:hypothetical protein
MKVPVSIHKSQHDSHTHTHTHTQHTHTHMHTHTHTTHTHTHILACTCYQRVMKVLATSCDLTHSILTYTKVSMTHANTQYVMYLLSEGDEGSCNLIWSETFDSNIYDSCKHILLCTCCQKVKKVLATSYDLKHLIRAHLLAQHPENFRACICMYAYARILLQKIFRHIHEYACIRIWLQPFFLHSVERIYGPVHACMHEWIHACMHVPACC